MVISASCICAILCFCSQQGTLDTGISLFRTDLHSLRIFQFEEAEKYEEKLHFKEFVIYFFKFQYISSARQKINGRRKGTVEDGNCQPTGGFAKDIIILLVSCAAIIIGAKYFVDKSIFFAELLGIPETIIGTTLVAVGTSLPELAVTASAAKQGLEA